MMLSSEYQPRKILTEMQNCCRVLPAFPFVLTVCHCENALKSVDILIATLPQRALELWQLVRLKSHCASIFQ